MIKNQQIKSKIKIIKKNTNLSIRRNLTFEKKEEENIDIYNQNNSINRYNYEQTQDDGEPEKYADIEDFNISEQSEMYDDMTGKEKEIYKIDINFIKNGYIKYKYLNEKITYDLLKKSFKSSCFDKNFIIPNKRFFDLLYPKFNLDKYKKIVNLCKISFDNDEEYLVHFHNHGLYEIKNKLLVI
jgi:hypothetical protein